MGQNSYKSNGIIIFCDMHIYTLCPQYLQSLTKFCAVVRLTKKTGLKDWLTGQTLYNPLNFVVLGIII